MNGICRYNMGWSQVDKAWFIVYAPSLQDAELAFERGDYQLEERE